MDLMKRKMQSWSFQDSIAWKKNRCASKAQRRLIDRLARSLKKSARQEAKRAIHQELKKIF